MKAQPPVVPHSDAPRWPGSAEDRARILFVVAPGDGWATGLSELIHQRKPRALLWSGGEAERKLALDLAAALALECEAIGGTDADFPWDRIRARRRGETVLAVVAEADLQRWLATALRSRQARAHVSLEPGKLAIVDVDERGIAIRGLNLDAGA